MNGRAEHASNHRAAFADRLRMLLVQKCYVIAPQQLADEMTNRTKKPVGAQAFGNWLNGVQIPNHGNLIALAAFLSVTPEFLLEGTPVLQFAPAKHTGIDTDQLVADFQRLSQYGRRMVLAMVAAAVRLNGDAA